MKILYVITSADHGGAQQYSLLLAKHFKGSIACGVEESWLFEEAQKQQIPTVRLTHLRRAINPYHDVLALLELRRLIKKERPDLIHLSSSKAGVIGSLAARGFKIPVIYTVHGFVLKEVLGAFKRPLYGFLERFSAKYREFTIAVSRSDKEALLAAHVASPEACSVVYNGLGRIDFLGRGIARQELGLPADGIVIGTVANLYQNKGIDTLIQAAAQLTPAARVKLAAIVVIGDGPEKTALERLLKLHGIQKLVRLIHLPPHQPAAPLLKAFDLFVLPSRKEGMPFALLEAMQATLPIIATDVGGVKEALGSMGTLVPSENPLALAQAIEKYISEPHVRKATSLPDQFSLQGMLAGTEAVYQKVA